MKTDKLILDACCGSKMFWFDKSNKDVLFMDIRSIEIIASNGRAVKIKPDVVADFRDMPFEDSQFNMVVLDPPHRTDLTAGNWMEASYGKLFPTWEDDITKAFKECFRVLKPLGVLIFKWHEKQIAITKILSLTPYKPLFGHPTKHGKTHWVTFMKPLKTTT